jgi:cellulase (glycosyl hydrolase family 5)/Calx-beta domain-containing protein
MKSKALMTRTFCCAIIGTLTLTACGAPDNSSSAASNGSTSSNSANSSAGGATTNSAGTMALSANTYTAAPASSAAVTIFRMDGSTGAATASYRTVNGSALAGVDYTTSQGSVTWGDGDTAGKVVYVPISSSASGKSFQLALTSVSSGAAIGEPNQATVAVSNAPKASSSGSSSSSSSTSSGGTTTSSGGSSSSSGGSSSSSGTASSGASGSSSGTSSSSSGSSKAFGIAVSGDKFVSTQSGSIVQLLGVSVSGLEEGSSSFDNGVENYGNTTDPGFAAMASWNINLVRIPLNEETWLGKGCITDGGSAATLQSNVKQAVANANAAGIYVILDLHWAAPDSFGCPEGQGSMPDADNSVAFWTSVATAFKGNPAVIFELFNEPFGTNNYGNWIAPISSAAPSGQSASDVSILVHGGTYYNGYMYDCNNGCNRTKGDIYTASGGQFVTAGYQAMIDAIRATGATNVILANPIGWAGQIETWPGALPVDPVGQLGVGWHEDGGASVTTASAQAVLSAGYPIVITEAYSIGDSTFTWAMSHEVGFSYWAWVDWAPSGTLSNAKSHAPSSAGTSLKNSYCTQHSVNSLSQC